jgi:hypothetical protein
MSYILSTLLGVWFLFSSVAHAFTPEWITHQTRGRVKYTQAVELISTINRHAFINEVDPQVVFKLIKIESGYRWYARSKVGAIGYMQVMPRYHRDKLQGRNPYNTEINIEVGIAILAEYTKKKGDLTAGLRAYYGDKTSNRYPNKVMAVSFKHYESPFPGSDDRAITKPTEPEPEVLTEQPPTISTEVQDWY